MSPNDPPTPTYLGIPVHAPVELGALLLKGPEGTRELHAAYPNLNYCANEALTQLARIKADPSHFEVMGNTLVAHAKNGKTSMPYTLLRPKTQ